MSLWGKVVSRSGTRKICVWFQSLSPSCAYIVQIIVHCEPQEEGYSQLLSVYKTIGQGSKTSFLKFSCWWVAVRLKKIIIVISFFPFLYYSFNPASLKWPSAGMVDRMYILRMEGEMRSFQLFGPTFWVTWQACPLADLLPNQEMADLQGGKCLGPSTTVWARALLPAPTRC